MSPLSDWSDHQEHDFDEEADDDLLDEDEPLVTCSACGREFAELSPRCPLCGEWVTQNPRSTRPPRWVLLTAILCVILALTWLIL